jgi:membrane-anchored glycerophosphoryl diester phosphodiesterase (GDPDase)
MIVLYFIVGLVVTVVPFLIMYFLGRYMMQRSGEYDEYTDFVEILGHGFLGLSLVVIVILFLFIIFFIGKSIVDSLF